MLIKCEFWNCTFENCQIENCKLTRANFHESNFKECSFLNSDLTRSEFSNFELIETKFKNSKLDFLIATDIKVSRSNQSIEVEESFKLEKTLKDMNLIISSDQDNVENS